MSHDVVRASSSIPFLMSRHPIEVEGVSVYPTDGATYRGLPSQFMRHKYRNAKPDDLKAAMCFEILGFDILVDQKLKPWLLEINYTPSFRVDTPLDHNIKSGVITGTLRLVDI